jgi:uncharacterized DUF497 family protein
MLQTRLRPEFHRCPVKSAAVIGRMEGKHWSAVVTYREDRIGIISVRRARDEEIRIYEV